MIVATQAQLNYALESICPASAYAATRHIAPDDHLALSPGESRALAGAVAGVRNASGAARGVAKALLRGIGKEAVEILRAPEGFPVWPEGFVGSLSHTRTVAAAIVARSDSFDCLGIDIEEPEEVESELARLIVREEEEWAIRVGMISIRQVFSVKEAVFKALYPRDRVMLDFQDVALDFETGSAMTRYGAAVKWRSARADAIFSVAWRPRS
ncbi:4'-phosphopantetheinyl transferase family protein [Sphingomonas molluscorum]|uniref:4'-phosphopantetheinyl transferase family protein n=1 Tax=Sphingomonas molluscorum TaxID=418184 RepID=UPI0031DF88D9